MKLHPILLNLLLIILPLQLGRHFWPEWSYVYGLKIDYLAPTVYLTDILIIFLLGVWLWEKPKARQKPLAMLFFLFLLVVGLISANPQVAILKNLKIIELFWLGFYISQTAKQVKVVSYGLMVGVVYSSLIAFGQMIKQGSLGGVFYWLGERSFSLTTPGIAKTDFLGRLIMRPYATFSHPNSLAGFVLVCLILTLGFIYRKNKLVGAIYFFLSVLILVISFSRSVWLVGLLVLMIVLKPPKKFLVIPAVIFLLIVLWRLPFLASLNERLDLSKAALQMIKVQPLTGVGLNNFLVLLPQFWQSGQTYWLQPVHNIFLLIGAETGLVGLTIVLWFLFLTFKRLQATNDQRLTTALVAILALGLFDHYWLTLQQNQLLLAVILGLAWRKRNSRSLGYN